MSDRISNRLLDMSEAPTAEVNPVTTPEMASQPQERDER